jgi:hypothetical protein
MKALVACEFSGIVRDAFAARGHDAWSCDLLASESENRQHIQCEDENHLWSITASDWDLMIAHPPCTYLCNSGVRWLYKDGKGQIPEPKRWDAMMEAAKFFQRLLDSPIKRICIENPIMHSHAAKLITTKPNQIIQPWQFGHGEIKATCLWLKNLPPLQPTDLVSGRTPRVHHAQPGPERWKERSRTFPGIAKAMAEQWG